MTKTTTMAMVAGFLGFASACKPMAPEEARNALPAAEALTIKLPGSAAMSGHGHATVNGVGVSSEAVLGQTAQFYQFTRGVTDTLNGGSAVVLGLVHAITEYPVTSVEGDTYIWGPWNGNGLQPSQYRLTVRQNDVGEYEWSLEGRHKVDAPSGTFIAVVSGVATPGTTPGHGSGTFEMNFDNAELLDPAGNNAAGILDATYDLEASPRTLVIDWMHDSKAFHYSYAENTDGSGDFQFTLHDDIDHDTAALEDGAVRTRWQADGEGRSDVDLANGDFGTLNVTASECWDQTYGRVYWSDSVGFEPSEGSVASCAFASALYPGE
jgi:hypothetical protein